MSESNWADASRRLVDDVRTVQRRIAAEEALVCPGCGAANRPGATYVHLEAPDRAVCIVCARAFDPRVKE